MIALKLRKEYLNIVIYKTPVLLWIKYLTVWYVEHYSMSTCTGVENFLKIGQFFGPPCGVCKLYVDDELIMVTLFNIVYYI